MAEYTVTWTAVIEADTPQHAARIALEAIMKRSDARNFIVEDDEGTTVIDLDEPATPPAGSRSMLKVVK